MADKKTKAKKTTTKTASKKVAKKPASKTASLRKTTVKKKAAPKKAANASAAPKTKAGTVSFTTAQPFMKEMEKIMTKPPFKFDQLAQQAADQSRDGFEAFMQSGTIFFKGFEEIARTAASMTQTAVEKQAEFTKQLMSSKTLNEYAEAQNKIAQANFDEFMAGATKLSEMSVKVLSEASEPLNSQMNKAVQQANKAMAA